MVCCLVEWIVCCLSEWIVCLYEIDLDPHVVWTPCFMIFRPFVGLPVMYIPNNDTSWSLASLGGTAGGGVPLSIISGRRSPEDELC